MNLSLINKEGISPIMQEVEKLTVKLNARPDKKWLLNTPDNKAQYIPIEIIEAELSKDFAGLVQYEILSERRELNEYIVTARIKVFHPYLLQWMNYDGIGAVQIMQDKDAKISEFNDTKKKNALQLNAPKAYAEAIKNAAKKIGKKYGADINRKSEGVYEPEYTLEAVLNEVVEMVKKSESLTDLSMLWETYPELHKANKFKVHFVNRKKELSK